MKGECRGDRADGGLGGEGGLVRRGGGGRGVGQMGSRL